MLWTLSLNKYVLHICIVISQFQFNFMITDFDLNTQRINLKLYFLLNNYMYYIYYYVESLTDILKISTLTSKFCYWFLHKSKRENFRRGQI